MASRLSSIDIRLSQPVVRYQPGGPPATLAVTVLNLSEQFASFLLDIDAAGADPDADAHWYQLYPEIGTKKPPGDTTQFHIRIIDNPVPGFTGTMSLTVRIFSLELQQEERQLVRLIVEPGQAVAPVEVSLPVSHFSPYPDAVFPVPVELQNPAQVPVPVRLQCTGLPETWQVLPLEPPGQVAAGAEVETALEFRVPPPDQAPSGDYPFTVVAIQPNGLQSSATGTIQVLPQGYYQVSSEPPEQDFPSDDGHDRARFAVAVRNASNLPQSLSLSLASDTLPAEAMGVPATALLAAGDAATLEVQLAPTRPLLGPPRFHGFSATVQLSDPRLEVRDETQDLGLWVKPRIPFWLQLLGSLAVVLLLLLPLLLRRPSHQGPVNDIQISGDADRIISGSSDQQLRRWRIQGERLRADGVLANLDKAVRVVRYRPVSNNLVAVGLENGEISLWDLFAPSGEPLQTLVDDKANRVLGLEFTPAASYLFSSHGSGAVLQWEVGSDLAGTSRQSTPSRSREFDFAVYALARVDEQGDWLAIAGRYNRLLLWNWQNDSTYDLNPAGSQNDYIQSLVTPEFRPHRLATADNQGRIQLWDVSACLPTPETGCEELLDQWDSGHQQRPVRSLAFTADGCYLASVGDDRRVMLWPLAIDGRRSASWLNGRLVRTSEQKLNTVAAVLNAERVLVSSGGDDHRVHLDALRRKRLFRDSQGMCDSTR